MTRLRRASRSLALFFLVCFGLLTICIHSQPIYAQQTDPHSNIFLPFATHSDNGNDERTDQNPTDSPTDTSAESPPEANFYIEPFELRRDFTDKEINLTVGVNKTSQDPLLFAAESLPPGVTMNPKTGEITGTATESGTYTVSITVKDESGRVAQMIFTWVITIEGNANPSLEKIGAQSTQLNQSIMLQLVATDPDGDALTYRAEGLPTGLTLDKMSGLIQGSTNAVGSYIVHIIVGDGNNGEGEALFMWHVAEGSNRMPTLSKPEDQRTLRGTDTSITISASDADGDQLNYQAAGLPNGLSIDSTSGIIAGTPVTSGTFSVTVSVSDGKGGHDEETFIWFVTLPTNQPPVLFQPASQNNLVGDRVQLQITATDIDEDQIRYFATGLPDGLALDLNSGLINGIVTQTGSFKVILRAVDSKNNSGATAFAWDVSMPDAPQPEVPQPEDPQPEALYIEPLDTRNDFTGSEVNFTFPISGDNENRLTFDAESLPPGVDIDPNTGEILGAPTQSGTYDVTVKVKDNSGRSTQMLFTWVVMTEGNARPTLEEIAPKSTQVNQHIMIQLAAIDPDNDPLTFTAEGLPAGVAIDSTSGLIQGEPRMAGAYAIAIRVDDGKNGSDEQAFTWNVSAPNNAMPTITQPENRRTMVGTAVTLEIDASDADGEPLTYSATGLPGTLSIDSASGVISGTLAMPGTFNISVSVNDGQGGHAEKMFVWYVTLPINQAPVLQQPSEQSNLVGESVQFQIVATDADQDRINYSASGLPDGLAIDADSGLISGTVTSAGTFDITINAADNEEGVDTTFFSWYVSTPENANPVLQNPGEQIGQVGNDASLAISATDVDSNLFSYSASGLPEGLTINAGSGRITGIFTLHGTSAVTITVSDDAGGHGKAFFTWYVNPPANSAPVIETPSAQLSTRGESVSLFLSASDVDGDAITYSASTLPNGLTIDSSTGEISGIVTTMETMTTTVAVSDGVNSAVESTFAWAVQAAPGNISLRLSSANDVTLEDAERPVSFAIKRIGDPVALDLYFEISGTEMAGRSSVEGSELLIVDNAGTVLTDHVTMPADRNVVTVTIQVLSDDRIEVPEKGFLKLVPHKSYRIDPNNSESAFVAQEKRDSFTTDSKVFVALFGPQDNANTSASGMATIRLRNDNHLGRISVNFTGLTSPQIAAHIHEVSTGNVVFSIPIGQVNDREWPIKAADPMPTDQATLDALMNGQLYINIHSREYPSGEIKGILMPANGSFEMVTPAAPDPIETLTDDELERDIARFLTQATFGPTPATVAEMKARIAAHNGDRIAAYDAWLEEQMQLESPSLVDYYTASRNLYFGAATPTQTDRGALKNGLVAGWFTSAVYSKAQLRERIGFALSEIFVISTEERAFQLYPTAPASYYDMLRNNAFTDFETVLTDVSTHPAMGRYLSHMQNRAQTIDENGDVLTSPDENYAREIMQLFTIGLIQLHPDGSLKISADGLPKVSYDQSDITELARVFTGWAMAVRNPDDGDTDIVAENSSFSFLNHNWAKPYNPSWTHPMKVFEDNGRDPSHSRYIRYHDNGEKTVLGETIPAGLPGEEDLARIMTVLSEHPNTAPFIAYRLIQRLVTSNPSAGYLYRVSTTFTETDGDLGAVVRAILLDPEARNYSYHDQLSYGKMKEPVVHYAAMLRLIEAKTTYTETYTLTDLIDLGLPQGQIARFEADTNILFFTGLADQTPLNAPSVFNWFQPNYAPAGLVSSAALVAPELQLSTPNQIINYYNSVHRLMITTGQVGYPPEKGTTKARITYELPQWAIDSYMATMDSNGDGAISEEDEAFSQPASVLEATTALVNQLDLHLCGGRLQASATGDEQSDAHTILANGLVDIMDNFDNKTAEKAITARNKRIQYALYLVGTAPDCLMQQ